VTRPNLRDGAAAARARAWRSAGLASVCDVLEPWEHGTVARTTRFPDYWDFNVVRVEDRPGMSVGDLAAFADEALAGLEHRRLDFDRIDAAQSLRAEFDARGWKATPLVWMHHEVPPPLVPPLGVKEVPYDTVADLRLAFHHEDFPDLDPGGYPAAEKEIALARGVRVLAASENGVPIAFAELERDGDGAEVTSVFVDAQHRGVGLGTALTRAAIEAAGDAQDLWIVADDENERAKGVYTRLGFRPAWRMMEFLRPPDAA
jgi:ribosomal protein S18 acetylase RimI-like enzyme